MLKMAMLVGAAVLARLLSVNTKVEQRLMGKLFALKVLVHK